MTLETVKKDKKMIAAGLLTVEGEPVFEEGDETRKKMIAAGLISDSDQGENEDFDEDFNTSDDSSDEVEDTEEDDYSDD